MVDALRVQLPDGNLRPHGFVAGEARRERASGLTRLDEAGLPKLHQRAAAAERIKQRCASEPITAFAAKQGSSIGRPKTCSVGSAGGFRGRWSVGELPLRQRGRGEDRRDAFFSFRASTEIGVRALLEFESPVSLRDGGRARCCHPVILPPVWVRAERRGREAGRIGLGPVDEPGCGLGASLLVAPVLGCCGDVATAVCARA